MAVTAGTGYCWNQRVSEFGWAACLRKTVWQSGSLFGSLGACLAVWERVEVQKLQSSVPVNFNPCSPYCIPGIPTLSAFTSLSSHYCYIPCCNLSDSPSVLFPVNLFYLRFPCFAATTCIIEEAKVNKESPRQSPSPVPFALSFRIWIPFTFLLLPLGELISACGRICGRQGLRNSPAENKSLFVHFSFPFADSTVNSFTHQSLEVLHKLLQFCETTLDINKLQITQNFEDHINPKPQLRKTENPSSKGQRFQTFAQDVGTKYDY